MQKYLKVYLTLNATSLLISATQVTGVIMSAVNTVQIRYHDGGTATITLSDGMTANDISASNYFADQIVEAIRKPWTNVVQETTTASAQEIPGIADAAGAAVTCTSVVFA